MLIKKLILLIIIYTSNKLSNLQNILILILNKKIIEAIYCFIVFLKYNIQYPDIQCLITIYRYNTIVYMYAIITFLIITIMRNSKTIQIILYHSTDKQIGTLQHKIYFQLISFTFSKYIWIISYHTPHILNF